MEPPTKTSHSQNEARLNQDWKYLAPELNKKPELLLNLAEVQMYLPPLQNILYRRFVSHLRNVGG